MTLDPEDAARRRGCRARRWASFNPRGESGAPNETLYRASRCLLPPGSRCSCRRGPNGRCSTPGSRTEPVSAVNVPVRMRPAVAYAVPMAPIWSGSVLVHAEVVIVTRSVPPTSWIMDVAAWISTVPACVASPMMMLPLDALSRSTVVRAGERDDQRSSAANGPRCGDRRAHLDDRGTEVRRRRVERQHRTVPLMLTIALVVPRTAKCRQTSSRQASPSGTP